MDIVDRVRKLIALAESTHNVEEALAAELSAMIMEVPL